jgi:hypothetical protein
MAHVDMLIDGVEVGASDELGDRQEAVYQTVFVLDKAHRQVCLRPAGNQICSSMPTLPAHAY